MITCGGQPANVLNGFAMHTIGLITLSVKLRYRCQRKILPLTLISLALR
jgi:hypothetical protein